MNNCTFCGKEAFFQFKNGNWCCSDNANKCPSKREKDSIKKKGKPVFLNDGHPHGKLGKPSWNSGKKIKDIWDEERAKEYGEKISIALKSSEKHCNLGRALKEEDEINRRKKISDAIKIRYANGWMPKAGRCKKIKYKNSYGELVMLDGTWELECAKYLDRNNFKWTRNKNRFSYNFENKDRYYTPDFFLSDFNVYLEVKGYATNKDRSKWKQFPYRIVILQKNEIFAMRENKFDMMSYLNKKQI